MAVIETVQFIRKDINTAPWGSGTTLATVDLSVDELGNTGTGGSGTKFTYEYRDVSDAVLRKVQVDAFLFVANDNASTWKRAMRRVLLARLNLIRTSCLWKPFEVKQMARGVAVIPTINQQWGDLVEYRHSGVFGDDPVLTTILDKCLLVECNVRDDIGINGIGLTYVFGRVADSLTPA